jgi:predicted phosphodiesterase
LTKSKAVDIASLTSDRKVYNDAPVLNGSTLVIMDVQVPYQDGEFLYKVLRLARQWGIKQGISGGDFFNQSAFSWFQNKPKENIWKTEKEKARVVFTIMRFYIPKWLMILGNHDALLLKTVNHQLEHEDIFKLADITSGVTITDYYYCLVKDKLGNEWRISHPRNISVIPGRVPQALSEKYQQNIIAGHGHLAGVIPSKSGKFLCIDAGVCCDPLRLDYTQERDNTRPVMNKGAVILKEVKGRIIPYHLTPEWTDWDAMMKLY